MKMNQTELFSNSMYKINSFVVDKQPEDPNHKVHRKQYI